MSEAMPRRRSGLSLATRVRTTIFFLAVVPVFFFTVALAQDQRTDHFRSRLSRANAAALEITQLHADMSDEETGFRGFLLSRDPSFLEPYTNGRALAARDIAALTRTLADAPLHADVVAVAQAKSTWEAMAAAGRAQMTVDDASLNARKTAFDTFRARLDALQASVQRTQVSNSAAFTRARNRRRLSLRVGLVGVAITSVVGAMFLIRWLRAPLEQLAASIGTAAVDLEEVAGEVPPELHGVARQIGSLQRAYKASAAQQVQQGLVAAQEEERRQIAAGIHDNVIQALSAARIRLQILDADTLAETEKEVLAKTDAALDTAVSHLRTMLFELSPPALERHGLVAALSSFVEEASADAGLTATVDGSAGDASLNLQAIAYRCGRELVTNIIKHAGAHTLTVDFSYSDHVLHVRITDDGNGFDANAAPRPRGHHGLKFVEELIAASGGALQFSPRLPAGTVTEFALPEAGRAVAAAGAAAPEEVGTRAASGEARSPASSS